MLFVSYMVHSAKIFDLKLKEDHEQIPMSATAMSL